MSGVQVGQWALLTLTCEAFALLVGADQLPERRRADVLAGAALSQWSAGKRRKTPLAIGRTRSKSLGSTHPRWRAANLHSSISSCVVSTATRLIETALRLADVTAEIQIAAACAAAISLALPNPRVALVGAEHELPPVGDAASALADVHFGVVRVNRRSVVGFARHNCVTIDGLRCLDFHRLVHRQIRVDIAWTR